MKMCRCQRLFYALLRGCLLLFLLAACGSTTVSDTNAASTSIANPGPTATPLVTDTSVPIQVPKLTVTFRCKTGSKEGFFADQSHAFACVRTLPGASMTISVSYCNGNSDQSSSLKGTFTADSTGYYQWDWTPKAPCSNGPAYWSGKAMVTAQLNGQTSASESTFQGD